MEMERFGIPATLSRRIRAAASLALLVWAGCGIGEWVQVFCEPRVVVQLLPLVLALAYGILKLESR
jgi:hypothetical protein